MTDLLRAVAAKELDLVLCYAQDRLARDEYLWHFMRAMAFERTGTSVLFARDDYDISTPEGQMMSSMHAMIAGQEREKTRNSDRRLPTSRIGELQNGSHPSAGSTTRTRFPARSSGGASSEMTQRARSCWRFGNATLQDG